MDTAVLTRSDFGTDPAGEPVRFADILTTASAVANYLGADDVTAAHVIAAIDVLEGTRTFEDLGRPVSPLVPRRAERGVDLAVRDLAQRWWRDLGEDVNATLDEAAVGRLRDELGEVQGDRVE